MKGKAKSIDIYNSLSREVRNAEDLLVSKSPARAEILQKLYTTGLWMQFNMYDWESIKQNL